MSKGTKIFLFNLLGVAVALIYASTMEHRCNRCFSYSLAALYLIFPIIPFVASMVGATIGAQEKSRFGFWSNACTGALLTLFFLALIAMAGSGI